MTTSALLELSLSAGIAISIGFFFTALLLPSSLRRFAVVFSPVAGAGVCSLVAFAFRRPMITVECLLLAGLVVAYIFRTKATPNRLPFQIAVVDGLFVLVLLVAVSCALHVLILRTYRVPDGEWDGWALWNMHARMIFFNGPHWRQYLPQTFHADYPLLTPLLTARSWRYAATDTPEAGAALGILFALSATGILVMTLWELRDRVTATLAGLILLSTPFFIQHATSQYADLPIAVFILSSIALISLYSERASHSRGLLVLAGFLAGCAGWTKNEGLLFMVVMSAVLLFQTFWRRVQLLSLIGPFVLGMLPSLTAIVVFKLSIASQNDLIQYQSHTLHKILSMDRYALIGGRLLHELWSFGDWKVQPLFLFLVFIVATGFDRRVLQDFGWTTSAIMLLVMLSGYFGVYIVTPLDLQYHLDSSMRRLLLHLWPSFLFVLGLTTSAKVGGEYSEMSERGFDGQTLKLGPWKMKKTFHDW